MYKCSLGYLTILGASMLVLYYTLYMYIYCAEAWPAAPIS